MSPRLSSVLTVAGAAPARGFVLVGVAMFVLVLTILGLSLFTLSGFEAQFFARSNERSQAFNTAASGIERARFALLATNSLQVVWQRLPGDGLEYPVAVQGGTGPTDGDFTDGDSTSLVDWSGEDIWIRTVGRAGQARVVLQARFDPNQSEDFYKRLISARFVRFVAKDTLTPGSSGTGERWSQTYIDGEVMQRVSGAGDTAWAGPSEPAHFNYRPVQANPDLPVPELVSYFEAHLPSSESLDGLNGNYTLFAGSEVDNVKYFKTVDHSEEWAVLEQAPNPKIIVGGTAVWLVDWGLRFLHKVAVELHPGSAGARLIIVSRPEEYEPNQDGINFRGGVDAPASIPVILVSDGEVILQHKSDDASDPNYKQSSSIGYLSIFAAEVRFMGPEKGSVSPDPTMVLSHLPGPLDPVIDKLYALGVLPAAGITGQGKLTQVPGTWGATSTNTASNSPN